jgi:hypothetical protein
MAAAHVSGIAALMASVEPWADAADQKECIRSGADPIAALDRLLATGARADAAGALWDCGDKVAPNVAPVPLAPADGARVRPKGLTFRYAPGSDALSGVVSNTVLVDGSPAASAAARASRAKLRQTPRLRDGRHSWFVRSSDRFGNSVDSRARTLVVDGTGPRARVAVRRRSAAKGIRTVLRLNESASVAVGVKLLRRRVTGGRASGFRKGRNGLTIRLPRKLRAKAKGARAKVTLRLTDALGNVTRKRFSVRLR